MIIFPAIDILDRECVRLLKGQFETHHKVAESAMDTAFLFKSQGAEYLHMVDLNGAVAGKPQNMDIFIDVAQKTGLKVEVGGGIRNIETVRHYLDNGIDRVILGTAALKEKDFLTEAVKKFSERIVVGIDALNGKVSTEGWLNVTSVDYIAFAKEMAEIGVKNIIFTDISKDGTLEGPNIDQLVNIIERVPCNIIASGGIKNLDHVRQLKSINAYGAICGKALYSGTLSLSDALNI